mmetsp:Transcript_15792/g.54910  ORF Transcript_15792/g.54910 Transcript_15792/m.54910 type:complete len:207 (-) Transcript_15792:1517-2137(-)
MPAPKLRPVLPSTTTVPFVMYSQQWSPAPMTTAVAPELRTAKRSPARPAANSRPPVAPNRQALPTMTEACAAVVPPDRGVAGAWKRASAGGVTRMSPPAMPLPTKSCASPRSTSSIPGEMNAPNDWPATPWNCSFMVPPGARSARRSAVSTSLAPAGFAVRLGGRGTGTTPARAPRPASPKRRAISPDRRAPTLRLELKIGKWMSM